MDKKFIEFIKQQFGITLQTDYSALQTAIARYKLYYQGYDRAFHNMKLGSSRKTVRVKSLELGKTIAETWAGLVVNENTDFQFKDDAVRNLLVGTDKINQRGGIFGANNLWQNLSKWGEKIFGYAGSGVFVCYADNADLIDMRTPAEIEAGLPIQGILRGGDIKIKFVPSDQIIPISYEDDRVTEIMICGRRNYKGQNLILLEVHRKDVWLENNQRVDGYRIDNFVAVQDAQTGNYTINAALCEQLGLVASVRHRTRTFSDLWNTAFANNKQDCMPFALPAISGAIDQIQDADIAFNNRSTDIILGRKRVFIPQDYIATRLEKVNGESKAVATDGDELFTAVPHADEMKTEFMKVYDPSLRVDENVRAVQSALDLVSFKVGLGKSYFKFDDQKATVHTAYEVKNNNADLQFTIQRHRTIFLDIFPKFCNQVVALHNELNNADLSTDTNDVTIKFDDGALKDPESERARDLVDVQSGLMAKWEYRVKWYNETEAQAKEMVESIKVPTLGDFYGNNPLI